MSDITPIIDRIRHAAATAGVAKLAMRARVPYTTLKAFANRGWQRAQVSTVERLALAASELLAEAAANDNQPPSPLAREA